MTLNTPRSDPISLTERGLTVVQAEATRTAKVWITTFGVLALLPVPLALISGTMHQQRPSQRVACSAFHPCPLEISIPGQPFSRLPMWEVVTNQP